MHTVTAGAPRAAFRDGMRAATVEALIDLGGEARTAALRDVLGGAGTDLGRSRLLDGLLQWSLVSLRRDGAVERPAWDTWRIAGYEPMADPEAGSIPQHSKTR